jgi:hypothetical protein
MHGKLPHLMGFEKGKVLIDEYAQLHENTKQWTNETSQIMECEKNKQLKWKGPQPTTIPYIIGNGTYVVIIHPSGKNVKEGLQMLIY